MMLAYKSNVNLKNVMKFLLLFAAQEHRTNVIIIIIMIIGNVSMYENV